MSKHPQNPLLSEPKPTFLKDLEDVISTGALLRPTLERAVSQLDGDQLELLKEIVAECEKKLSLTAGSEKEKMRACLGHFERTFAFGPLFRFTHQRLKEIFIAETQFKKSFGAISLTMGILFERCEEFRQRFKKSA